MITDAMRASLQAAVGSFLSETCDVAREVVTMGEYGEQERHWQALAAGVACRLITPKYNQRALIAATDGREAAKEEYGLIVPVSAAALQVKDRVTVNGQEWYVTQLANSLTDLPFQRVMVSAGEAGIG